MGVGGPGWCGKVWFWVTLRMCYEWWLKLCLGVIFPVLWF